MEFFDLHAYCAALEQATDIQSCPKVPCPKDRTDRNYIFISYAHQDYKTVYKALAYMYAAGVRFWYDRGLTAGVNWESEATDKIRHPNCSGAVFFFSEHLFLSESVVQIELPCILGVDAKGNPTGEEKLNYFCVNLSDNRPSDILFSVMASLQQRGHGTAWIRLLTTAFPDEITYVSATEMHYPDTLIQQVKENFNVVEDAASDTDTLQYEGETLNGKPHGKGRLTFPPHDMRDCYEGDFVGGRMQGKGVLRFKNGDVYEGDFAGNEIHGQGTCTYSQHAMPTIEDPDAHGKHVYQRAHRIYEGEWKRGMRDGQGTLRSAFTGSIVYQGEWKNDLPHGRGQAFFHDFQSTYDGEWKNGKPNGKGVYRSIYVEWLYYGEWVDGKRCGSGTEYGCYYPNGDNYRGQWRDDKRNGYGELTHSDGRVEKGIWQDNVLVEPQE